MTKIKPPTIAVVRGSALNQARTELASSENLKKLCNFDYTISVLYFQQKGLKFLWEKETPTVTVV